MSLPPLPSRPQVRDWEAAAHGAEGVSEQAVGRATGLLAAMFCAAQLVTSYPWGHLSDRIGRKVGAGRDGCNRSAVTLWARRYTCVGAATHPPLAARPLRPGAPCLFPPAQPLMVVGNLSGAATVLWFGLAGSYGQAMAARAIGGAANAIILAEKSILGGQRMPRIAGACLAAGMPAAALCLPAACGGGCLWGRPYHC